MSSTVSSKTSPEYTGPCHFWRRRECTHWGPSEERRGWPFVLATNASGMLHLRAVCSFFFLSWLSTSPSPLHFVVLGCVCSAELTVWLGETVAVCSWLNVYTTVYFPPHPVSCPQTGILVRRQIAIAVYHRSLTKSHSCHSAFRNHCLLVAAGTSVGLCHSCPSASCSHSAQQSVSLLHGL